MKILIGTPIHQVKDYCIEKWIENVSNLLKTYYADLLIIDNSPGTDYVKKVKSYLKKYKIKKYKIVHIELPSEQKVFERVARSREIIREHVLTHDYDAWFSWECDQIIPNDTLGKLIEIMKSENYQIVELNSWERETSGVPNIDWGVALINKQSLEKYTFILKFGSDPDMPDTWEPAEAWFRKQVLRGGGKYIDVYGVIGPIYHLNK